MALTALKYIIPSGSPVGGHQATESAAHGDAEISASLVEMSSGLVSYTNTLAGTALSVNTTSNNFAHGDLTIRIADNLIGSVAPLTIAGLTGITPTNLATSEITYLGAGASSTTIIQQATPFTPTQTRTIVPIGKILHHDNTNVTEALFQPAVVRASSSNFNDFLEMTGPVTSGFEISKNDSGSPRTLSIGAGRIMLPGIGMTATGSLAPNTIEFAARPNYGAYKHVTQDGTVGAEVTQVDTTNYNPEVGGVAVSTVSSSGSSWWTTRSIWQGFDGTVYVLYPSERDTNGENTKVDGLWYKQPVPHWLWEVAVPIALITAKHAENSFDQSTTITASVRPIIDQLQPIPTNWPYRTVQATVFPS